LEEEEEELEVSVVDLTVYTLGEFHKNRDNGTVFEELSVSIVDLTVANIRNTGFASRRQ
jgi:hypothetical protein